jgi:hypothetical protein
LAGLPREQQSVVSLRDDQRRQHHSRDNQHFHEHERRLARLIQADAALAPGVSQQTFEHAAGMRVAHVIPARTTPTIKIPFGSPGFSD